MLSYYRNIHNMNVYGKTSSSIIGSTATVRVICFKSTLLDLFSLFLLIKFCQKFNFLCENQIVMTHFDENQQKLNKKLLTTFQTVDEYTFQRTYSLQFVQTRKKNVNPIYLLSINLLNQRMCHTFVIDMFVFVAVCCVRKCAETQGTQGVELFHSNNCVNAFVRSCACVKRCGKGPEVSYNSANHNCRTNHSMLSHFKQTQTY